MNDSANDSGARSMIEVQVVFAEPDRAFVRVLTMAHGSTVEQAVAASGWFDRDPGKSVEQGGFGIFGQPADSQQALCDGDRVEIYRPLQIDPMASRRRRAHNSKR